MGRINEWKMNIYLSHGKNDRIVPPEQTKMFYRKLIEEQNNLDVEYYMVENHAHDYKFWGSELKKVFLFFEKF